MTGVAIVGAGLAGLTLGQLLDSAGIDIAVFERDPSLDASGRAVRIHCRPALNDVMADCLSAELFELFQAAQNEPDTHHLYLDETLRVTAVDERPAPEIVLDTATTRELLAASLADRIAFGADLDHEYTPTADLCVVANGADSVPLLTGVGAPLGRDVGLWSVYGCVDLDQHSDLAWPDWLDEGFIIADDGNVKIALGHYRPAPTFAVLAERYARAHPSPIAIRPRHYLFWNVIAPVADFGEPVLTWVGDLPATLAKIGPMTRHWDPWIGEVFARSQPATLGFLPLRTSAPGVARDPHSHLVLVGDAAHPMLPAALSTYVAVHDARTLGQAIVGAHRDESPLLDAAAQAFAEIQSFGFERVREAELAAGPGFRIDGLA